MITFDWDATTAGAERAKGAAVWTWKAHSKNLSKQIWKDQPLITIKLITDPCPGDPCKECVH